MKKKIYSRHLYPVFAFRFTINLEGRIIDIYTCCSEHVLIARAVAERHSNDPPLVFPDQSRSAPRVVCREALWEMWFYSLSEAPSGETQLFWVKRNTARVTDINNSDTNRITRPELTVQL